MRTAVAFGAPGIYPVPDFRPRMLRTERMDVCAFVGVAPRGPVRVPVEPEDGDERGIYVESFRPRRSLAVPIESWDQYRNLYGGYEGPGRLPYAVSNFFEQGGRRAYIVRIVHEYHSDENLDAVATHTLDSLASTSPVLLVAKNEGSWGNGLRADWRFQQSPIEIDPIESTSSILALSERQRIEPGSLLKLSHDSFEAVRFVERVWRAGSSRAADSLWFVAVEGSPLPTTPTQVMELTGALTIRDDATAFEEQFSSLGLSAQHPRFVARLLYRESELINPHESWIDARITPTDIAQLDRPPISSFETVSNRFTGGIDRYEDIISEDFFDEHWVLSNPSPGNGLHALTHTKDLSLVVTPDLYVPSALASPFENTDAPLGSRSEFTPCFETPLDVIDAGTTHQSLPGLMLDAGVSADLARIIELQTRVVSLAEAKREFVALLDVPPKIGTNGLRSWRSKFTSAYAAAYWPWVSVATLDDNRDVLVELNPASIAAGLIARQETLYGLSHGPANLIAEAVVAVERQVSPAALNEFHPLGLNAFVQDRAGVRLTGARTLSRDPRWRQLSVVRLMTMLKRALWRQMQWVVFEPNTPKLWADLRFKLEAFLRQLFIAGAFKGEFESGAFFVRCDEYTNSTRVLDAGKLVVEIGVAPVEPLEYLVVHITREGDGTLTVEG